MSIRKSYDKWSSEEKFILFKYVDATKDQTKRNWIECAKLLENRTPRQCYDFFVLNSEGPKEKAHHKWLAAEESLLLRQCTLGLSWKVFQQKYFPDLSISQLKNKLNRLMQSNSIKTNESIDSQKSFTMPDSLPTEIYVQEEDTVSPTYLFEFEMFM